MKQEVLKFFGNLPAKPAEQFNRALLLYGRAPNKNLNLHTFYNRAGYNPSNLTSILQDLKTACGITDTEFARAKRKKTAVKKEEKENINPFAIFDKANNDVKDWLKLTVAYPFLGDPDCPDQLKKLVADKAEAYNAFLYREKDAKEVQDIINKQQENPEEYTALAAKAVEDVELKLDPEVLELLEYYKEHQKLPEAPLVVPNAETVFDTAGDDVKAGLKVRQEFPFLRDPDCPDKLKILIADKITAYENFTETHRELFTKVADDETNVALTEEEIFALAKKAVENFELNRAIYDELNHYQETGEILGKHPIFAEDNLKKEVEAMSAAQLAKAVTNLRASISKEKTKMKRVKTAETKKKYKEKIKALEAKLQLVQARLNAKD